MSVSSEQDHARLRRARLRRLVPICVFVGLAAVMTWPLPLRPATQLPLGTSSAATVPMFNVWTIWWNADRLAHGLDGYWDAPIFAPVEDTFALSEPQPATWIVSPVVWTAGPVLAANAYLWIALTLNGLTAFSLLRSQRLTWFASLAGGCLIETLPFVQWQLGVLQLVPLCGVFWTIQTLRSFSLRPSLKHGFLVGLAFAVTYLICGHTALLLSLLLTPAAIWYPGKAMFSREGWTGLVVAVGTAVLALSPVVLHQMQVLENRSGGEDAQGWRRTLPERIALSLQLTDYLFPLKSPDAADVHGRARNWPASPGWLTMTVALPGAVFGLTRRRWRRWTAFLLTILCAAVALSLGPNLLIAGWRPYESLADVWPGLAHIRNVFRFAQFAQIATVLLACLAFHTLSLTARRLRSRQLRLSRLLSWTAPAAGLLCLLQIPPSGCPAFDVPAVSASDQWIATVRSEASEDTVVCLPLSSGNRLKDWELTTLWMYRATFHQQVLVNGYSGYFPPDYLAFRKAVNNSFPGEAAYQALSDRGVTVCVVDRNTVSRDHIELTGNGRWFLQWIAGDDQRNIDVYRLMERSPQ